MHQYIKVSGTPYERGFQYGSQAKERIYKVIEEYKVLFEKEAFITWDKAYELSKPYRKEIEKYRPDLVEEMKGIADGAGLDFNTILTLNCRSEIMFAKADIAEDACTTIGVPPEASENGHTLLAQNWDWWSMVNRKCFIIMSAYAIRITGVVRQDFEYLFYRQLVLFLDQPSSSIESNER